jgi:hypothetical protein
MRVESERATEQEQGLTLSRRMRDLRAIASKLKRSRMKPLQVCEAIIDKRLPTARSERFFSGPAE